MKILIQYQKLYHFKSGIHYNIIAFKKKECSLKALKMITNSSNIWKFVNYSQEIKYMLFWEDTKT